MQHLILYNSANGQTKKICGAIQHQMAEYNLSCQLTNITEITDNFCLSDYCSVLFGMPVRYGKHNKNMVQFIKNHQQQLTSMTTGLLSVNLTARKAEKNTPETNPYIQKLLQELQWKPDFKGVIAGALKYPEYCWFDRFMIRLIMKMTKGPTDVTIYTEFTNWDTVKQQTTEYIRHLA